MVATKKPNILFIDTNIYLKAIYEDGCQGGVNFKLLNSVLDKLKSKEILLIVPEVIEKELMEDIACGHRNIENSINSASIKLTRTGQDKKPLVDSFYDSELNMARKTLLAEYRKKHKKILKVVSDIINNNNSVRIALSNEILLAGIKRSALKTPPHNHKKESYLKDIDCIAYESLLSFLSKNKKYKQYKLIICSDDSDYCDFGTKKINKTIEEELRGVCNNVKFYYDFDEMMNAEFNKTVIKSSPCVHPNNSAKKPSSVIGSGIRMFEYKNDLFGNVVSRETENCPVCGGDIKDHLRGYFIKRDHFIRFSGSFECPFCGENLYII